NEPINHNPVVAIDADAADRFASEFEMIWKIYPKRTNKGEARKAYIEARKNGVSFEEIASGVRRYAARREIEIASGASEPRYTKSLVKWIAAEAWADEDQPPAASLRPSNNSDRLLIASGVLSPTMPDEDDGHAWH